MTLFSLARRNIKGNFRNYLIYFISMLCSVVIFYTFVSLRYSDTVTGMLEVYTGVDSIFLQASLMLILFVAVFILHSNSVFTRKRKKEVGLYALLGVRKRTIGLLLFYENLIMGILVLAAGIVLGTFLSKLFVMILVHLVGSELTVGITFSLQAVGHTALVFLSITLLTSLQGYRLIYRFPLIDLFQAEKKGDPELRPGAVSAVMSVVLLAIGYYCILRPIATVEEYILYNLVMLISLVTGTYLLFRHLTVFLLSAIRRRKNQYYNGMNLISITQLLYRVRGHARLFTVIALLGGAAIAGLGLVFSQYYVNSKSSRDAMPFSYMHVSQGEAFDRQVRQIITEDKDHPLIGEMEIPMVKLKGDLTGLGLQASDIQVYGESVRVMPERVYNEISELLGRSGTVRLADSEAAVIRPLYTTGPASDYVGGWVELLAADGARRVTVTSLLEGRAVSWTHPDFVLVVGDNLYTELQRSGAPLLYKAYLADKDRDAKSVSAQLMSMDPKTTGMATQYHVYKEGQESGGLDTFLVGFLGLVFLAATGSMIYFKQLSEAEEDRERYSILRRIGVSRREIRSAVANQTLFIFGLPLSVALMHSSVLLRSFTRIYADLMGSNIAVPVLVSMGAFAAIYFGYYLLTYTSYLKSVNR